MGLILSLIAGSWFPVKIPGRARLIAKPPEQLVAGLVGWVMLGARAALGTGCVIGNIVSGISLMSVGMVFFAVVVIGSNWATTYVYLMGARERSCTGPEPGWHGIRYRVAS